MRSSNYRSTIFLHAIGCDVQINCRDPEAAELLLANYGGMRVSKAADPALEYTIDGWRNGSQFRIRRCGCEPLIAADNSEVLFLFEKDLTIELQKLRRDLYFVHAATLAMCGNAFLLVAASGKGKSTTAWALLHHGAEYLSDELAPLDVHGLTVQPYPHAICLKRKPPQPYALPQQTLSTSSTLHIPTARLPNRAILMPMPLRAIFFFEYSPGSDAPELRAIGQAEAAARLYVHVLNPLAHAGDGLPAAVSVARNVACFSLASADLRRTCEMIGNTFKPLTDNHFTSRAAAGR